MKSNRQIIHDKPLMDEEQNECVRLFPTPKTWIVAPELNRFFDYLNQTLFREILPKVPCYWTPPVRGFLGRCHARIHPKTNNMHSVALEFPCNSPDGKLYDTMIHEMVHVYQTVMGLPLSHNKLFHSINKSKRVTYIHQNKRNLEPLLYPPRNIKINKMWRRANDIETQLQELSELLFEIPVSIPKCWWHSTKIQTKYSLESYWCSVDQTTKPNFLELSKKSFSPNEYHLIYILCTIASWKEIGNHKRRLYRNELFMQKKQEYFGDPETDTSNVSESPKIDMAQLLRFAFQQDNKKRGTHYTSIFVPGTSSSGKTHMLQNLYAHPIIEKS